MADFQPVEENLRHSFRVLAANRPTGDLREIAGVTIASAGASFQMFNAAFLSTPVSAGSGELERRISTAAVHFQVRALDWSFWLCQDLVAARLRPRSGRVFERYGLRRAVELPGMFAERVALARRKLPALDMRRVADEPTRLAFCDIGCTCFNVPLPWFREIFLEENVWNGDFVGWVGYVDGEPVTTAATVIAAGAVGVYNVATLPSRRRHGYGEAVMRYALEDARQQSNIERTILQATEYGLPLYLSMGYRVVTSVAVYTSAP